MMITTKTTVTFNVPEESVLARNFAEQHRGWIEATGSRYIGYTRQDTYVVNFKEEGEKE